MSAWARQWAMPPGPKLEKGGTICTPQFWAPKLGKSSESLKNFRSSSTVTAWARQWAMPPGPKLKKSGVQSAPLNFGPPKWAKAPKFSKILVLHDIICAMGKSPKFQKIIFKKRR